ncbi:MAG: hypothetical protein ABR538_17575 [Candidatus Binatia bacterium]
MFVTFFCRLLALGGVSILVLFGLPVCPANSANGDCGIPFTSGSGPKTSDCLFILRAGVGAETCAACVCDTNGNLQVSATDALLCLRVAVGQNLALSCPDCPVTTTIPETTTTTMVEGPTTTSTTTTLLPAGGCPDVVQWETRGRRSNACATNGDCARGTCDTAVGLCRTATDYDLGWSGLGHDSDLDDGSRLRVRVDCGAGDAPCGECTVEGVDLSTGNCRCSNNTRAKCDEPFGPDADDCPACLAGAFVGNACTSDQDCSAGSCGQRCSNDSSIVCTKNPDCPGGSCLAAQKCDNGKNCNINADCTGTCAAASQCQCFDGPPLPLVVGGTPFCNVQRLAADVSGTVDVDSGASSLAFSMRTIVHNGSTTTNPCPVCGGRCSNDAGALCVTDDDCAQGGACTLDPAAGDGSAGGFCVGGRSNGLSCDVDASNTSFPARPGEKGGAGYSLDCFPAVGQNISGSGLAVELVEATGSSELASGLSCGGLLPAESCPCRVCSGATFVPCSSDADCEGQGTCTGDAGSVSVLPNNCADLLCSDNGNGEGSCTTGPDARWCSGVVRADGRGFLPCTANVDCQPGTIGIDGGDCTLTERSPCFLDTIVARGSAHSRQPVTAAAFCMPAVSSAGRNAVIGLPGPARIRRQSTLASWCNGDPGNGYTPGSGGCLP